MIAGSGLVGKAAAVTVDTIVAENIEPTPIVILGLTSTGQSQMGCLFATTAITKRALTRAIYLPERNPTT
jgi:hypothetical protein